MYPELSEAERFPLLTPAGRQLLQAMRQHPRAPLWNWPNGEQLNAAGLARVQQFAQALNQPRQQSRPDWLDEFTEYCCHQVPFYRQRLNRNSSPIGSTAFDAQPSCAREDLAPHVSNFVPDDQSLDELIVFSTSGTTGHPTRMLFTPAVAACGVPLIEYALARYGVALPRGPQQVAITNVAAYKDAFTTAIVVAWLGEAGCVRVNLHPSAWRHSADCAAFINQWRAPVWLGDPVAFEQLLQIELDHEPQAIVSSIMHMPDALKAELARRFNCPVLDIIAMTEVGLLALRADDGHEVLPHDVYVEILGDDDRPVADGVRGEVTVTSRRNPLMPLVRYRTGDFAAMRRDGSRTILCDYQGRVPVLFELATGRTVHCMEVTRLMRRYPLMQYKLHQVDRDHFQFGYRGHVDIDALTLELSSLLDAPRVLEVEPMPWNPTRQRLWSTALQGDGLSDLAPRRSSSCS